MKKVEPTPRRGRPRAFDPDAALDKAMQVFWTHGYEGTSLPALTEAMGINRPSLYATFGNKESLFRQAVARYESKASAFIEAALGQRTARAVVEHLLAGSVGPCDKTATRGCMLVQGALACGEASESIRAMLAGRRGAVEEILRKRFERALAEGDLPPDADPIALAKFVITLQHGIAVQLASGASRNELLAATRIAMRAWPS